jgi:hypothetical protein
MKRERKDPVRAAEVYLLEQAINLVEASALNYNLDNVNQRTSWVKSAAIELLKQYRARAERVAKRRRVSKKAVKHGR